MKKRIFIVHGWSGSPNEGWLSWLNEELAIKGLTAFAPALPDPDQPRIEKWIPALTQAVGEVDEETYFVGHSLGCQAIARFLVLLPKDIKVGGAIFVAPFFKRLSSPDLIEPATFETAQHWLYSPLDLKQVATHIPKSVAIFSDNDPDVPLDNQDDLRDILHSEVIIEHNKGHFSPDDNVNELPIVLEQVLKLTK